MQHNLTELLEKVIYIIEMAYAYTESQTNITVRKKGHKDYVTSFDIKIENNIKQELRTLTPDIAFWGEEGGLSEDDKELCWVLDPIDGTINFIRKLPLHCISLALVMKGEPILGIIYLPMTNEKYWALNDGGAFLNGKRISVTQINDPEQAIVCFGDLPVDGSAIDILDYYNAALGAFVKTSLRVRIIGSAAIQLAWLASGRIDISCTWCNNPWDVLAGILLVKEAGGTVFDFNGDKYSESSKYVFASNDKLTNYASSIFKNKYLL
jgi:myo-inositol-1(or 4)-monophosphatase